MLIVGIDPGYKHFAFYIGEYTAATNQIRHIEIKTKIMTKSKVYRFHEMRKAIDKWALKRRHLLNNAQVVIERQPFLRFTNIVNYLKEWIPHALILDVRGMKKLFDISTGSHWTNKKAATDKFGWLVPQKIPFKHKHNLIDAFLLAAAYLVMIANLMSLEDLYNIPPFSNEIIYN